jgi:hypothetical protein
MSDDHDAEAAYWEDQERQRDDHERAIAEAFADRERDE